MALTHNAVLRALEGVKDPEIPVVSIVDLGIVQSVEVDGLAVSVAITPTFTGCPALELMREEIAACVRDLGAEQVDVPVVLDPPWSSDRISPAGRERMKSIGLAPPPPAQSRFSADIELSPRPDAAAEPVSCPFCSSSDTVVENPFGATICRSMHYCHHCQQPFEQFKAL